MIEQEEAEVIKSGIVIRNESVPASTFAAMLIHKASEFKSEIWIEIGERKANAKSFLGLVSLGLGDGDPVTLSVDGEDEDKALGELSSYLGSGTKA